MNRMGEMNVICGVVSGLALWVVACSSSSSGGYDQPASCNPGERTMTYSCSCSDGRSATGRLDACNGATVDACDCGQPRDCTSDLGCPVTQLCRGEDCGACQCAPPRV